MKLPSKQYGFSWDIRENDLSCSLHLQEEGAEGEGNYEMLSDL